MATKSREKTRNEISRYADFVARTFLFFVPSCAFLWPSSALAQSFSLDDIEFWVGAGQNRAALAIDWIDDSIEQPAMVWGYRWSGSAHGDDMLTAIIAADPRLFAKLGGTRAVPTAVFGLGYDANGNDQFALDDGTAFNEDGLAFTSPADLATALEAADYYAEGWFTGFWHYGVAPSNPYEGGFWSDTPVGLAQRVLTDGAWDSWTFSPSFNFASFAECPVAAPAPFAHGDFNRDGRVDSADYDLWRHDFGSTSETATDANGNGIVDAADYVVWRKQYHPSATANEARSLQNIPEPNSTLLLVVMLLWESVQRITYRRAL